MTVLVTGATRGLGLEIARSLLDGGRDVIGTGRSENDAVRGLRAEYGAKFDFFTCELAQDGHAITNVLSSALPVEVKITGLVNNAAIAYDDLVTNVDAKRLEQMFHVNTIVPILLTRFAIRRMLLHNIPGALVHISSVSAHTGYKGLAMYAATKASLEGLSKSIAQEWGPMKIRSNCVAPGFLETDMTSNLETQTKQRIYAKNALRSAVSLCSVAHTVRFLLSDESASITGQTFRVDAGA